MKDQIIIMFMLCYGFVLLYFLMVCFIHLHVGNYVWWISLYNKDIMRMFYGMWTIVNIFIFH